MANGVDVGARITAWNAALLEQLLPPQDEPGEGVVLALDDETRRAVAEMACVPAEQAAAQLGSDVRLFFGVGQIAGFGGIRQHTGAFASAGGDRDTPVFLGLLCLCVLAASRMAPDESHSTAAYYVHLRELLDLSGSGDLEHMDAVPRAFGLLASWLDQDLDNDATAWAAVAAIGAAFLIAGTFLLTRDQHRRADLARLRGSSAVAETSGAGTAGATTRTIPAEQFIPIWLASGHGLLGAATLILVLLERAGVRRRLLALQPTAAPGSRKTARDTGGGVVTHNDSNIHSNWLHDTAGNRSTSRSGAGAHPAGVRVATTAGWAVTAPTRNVGRSRRRSSRNRVPAGRGSRRG